MIHVECINICQITPQIYENLYAGALPERKKRADRYRRAEDKLCCIAADALLRYVARRILLRDEFELEYNSFGKPRIKNAEGFYYNISHSADLVMIAYGDSEAGIDVEKIRMNAGKEKLARRYFTDAECEYIFGAGDGLCAERFFQIWTAKESYVKYMGTGLRMPLNSFDVLSMEEPFLKGRRLEGDYYMTLCSMDKNYRVERLSVEQLL